jgi:hypothetical protein
VLGDPPEKFVEVQRSRSQKLVISSGFVSSDGSRPPMDRRGARGFWQVCKDLCRLAAPDRLVGDLKLVPAPGEEGERPSPLGLGVERGAPSGQ